MQKLKLKNIVFTSRAQAEASPGWPHWSVISIGGLNPAALKEGWHSVLRLEFDDVDVAEEPYILFDASHANQVIEFAQAVADSNEVEGILVHCDAGVSRSAAVAKWIAERHQLPFNGRYMLYNKHVYRELRKAFQKMKGIENGY